VEGNSFPQPRGYTVFAACDHFHQAGEKKMEGGKTHGLFTYCLMHTLMRSYTTDHVSARALWRQVRAMMLQNRGQVPVLEGDIDRAFFGTDGQAILPSMGLALKTHLASADAENI
jgi:hypothetical protein